MQKNANKLIKKNSYEHAKTKIIIKMKSQIMCYKKKYFCCVLHMTDYVMHKLFGGHMRYYI